MSLIPNHKPRPGSCESKRLSLVYVGLGSNMGDRLSNLREGVKALRKMGSILAVSSVYETEPWGREDQNWFLNAVVLLETSMSPIDLLRALKSAEAGFKREPGKWSPRELDMDILLYDGETKSTGELVIPHPEMGNRSFVLVPLAELFNRGAPSLGYPIGNICPDGKVVRLFSGPEAIT